MKGRDVPQRCVIGVVDSYKRKKSEAWGDVAMDNMHTKKWYKNHCTTNLSYCIRCMDVECCAAVQDDRRVTSEVHAVYQNGVEKV